MTSTYVLSIALMIFIKSRPAMIEQDKAADLDDLVLATQKRDELAAK